jgi:carbamoyltransferase
MIVLGIADNHDSGAAVVVDGQLVAAVNQERVDRVKNSGAFPWSAIDAALAHAGMSESDVDRIVVGTGFTPSTVLRALPGMHQNAKGGGQFSPLLHAYVVYQSLLRATGLHTVEVDASRRLLERRLLTGRPFGRTTVDLMDHHRAHAEGAYRTQPHEHCVVLTVDAMGDGTTVTASLGQDGQLDRLFRQSGLASINNFYSRITELLGFRANRHEGKITGLAAFVPPPPRLVAHMQTRVAFKAPGFTRGSSRTAGRPNDPFWAEIARWSREEVASAAQHVLEQAVVPFVQHWVRETGCRNVALGGGIFANVKLNQRINECGDVDALWVFPHMGDGGLAVGGALGAVGAAPRRLAHAYWGSSFGRRDQYKALQRGELSAVDGSKEPETHGVSGDVERVAGILAAGKVVARFDGAMEWGPRALCNRSLLARPNDPSINQWLNDKLDRSEFMPFAPVVRVEDGPRFFQGLDTAAESARFMTCCFEVTAEFQELAPAAVHVDGTARPQLLSAQENPAVHALLGRVGELTGAPVLINTSFNLHEEPIVCTPSDAVRAHKQAGLDALWMGPFVAERDAT